MTLNGKDDSLSSSLRLWSDQRRVHVPPREQTIYAPLGNWSESVEAELVLNNNSPDPMVVTPTFYTIQGTPIPGQLLTLAPAEVRYVALTELLPEGNRRYTVGGLALRYIGQVLEVGAQITLRQGEVGNVDVPFTGPGDYRSTVQEAVWWMPGSAQVTVVLGNASDVPVRVRVQDAAGGEEIISLDPHASRTLVRSGYYSPPPSEAMVGTLRLEAIGPVGSVRAWGSVSAPEESFITPIRFYDPEGIRQPHLFATGVRIAGTALHLVVKNTTDIPISVRPRIRPLSPESGRAWEGSPIVLEPHEAREIELGPILGESAAQPDFDRVSVQVVNESGIPGLIGALVGRNRSARLTYEVPLRDSGPIRNSTGSYPWRTDGDYRTVVSIANVGERPASFTVTINFPGGQYVLYPQELAVGEMAVFDLKMLQRERIPDSRGQVIPLSVTMGQFRWSVHGGDGTQRLMGRSEIVSPSRRMSSSYSCPVCCPYSFLGIALRPNSFVTPPGGSVLVLVDGFEQDCYGNVFGPFPSGAHECQSHNSSVLSAWLENGQIRAEGVSEGTATITAYRYDLVYWDDGMDCYSFLSTFRNDCDGEVRKPRISISEVRFEPREIDRTTDCSTLRVTLSATTEVPRNTRVLVEAFEWTKDPPEIRLTIIDNQRTAQISGGETQIVTFQVCTATDNTKSGVVKYKARILSVSDPNVDIGPPDEAVSDELRIR
jgi:hypothetical protein